MNSSMRLSGRAAHLISALALNPHPEGGYFTEVYRSTASVKPDDARPIRPALTSIYFLLPAGAVSRWHRVWSDEVWHFYEGAPLNLWIARPEASGATLHRLGPLADGQWPARTVPAGWWQAARSTGSYTLVGCTVAPGFEFQDFTMAADHAEIAATFRTRGGAFAELL
jgi:predicted cupin superfamily sugar epimerase